ERSIGRMEDRGGEPAGQRWRELVWPLDCEAVGAQRLVLGLELTALVDVCGEPQAAGAAEGIPSELREPVEVALGETPESARPLGSELLPRGVVRPCAAAESEATVASARAAGDLASVVQANPHAGPREQMRARAPRHAAADDGYVDAARR